MNGHAQFDEDFDLYALGALDKDEERALAAHLAGCPVCALKLEDARGRMAALSLAVPLETPRREVRERLLAQVAGRPGGHVAAGFVVWGRWLVPALAATSIVLSVALRNEVVRSHHRAMELERAQTAAQQLEIQAAHSRVVLDILTAPDTVKVTLVAGAARPVPQGKAFYHSTKGLLFYVVNLPQLPRDRIYQLWLIPQQGNPISAGIFQTDARGDGQILLPQLPSGVTAKAFAVTIEPAGGVPQPTGPKVLVGVVS